MPLNVSGAFHSHLMEPAKVEFRKFIEDIPFNAPVIPVIQNVSAKAETDPETIKAQLIDQLTSPVRFVECIEAAAAAGVEEAVEVGPKKGVDKWVASHWSQVPHAASEEVSH
jgi:[acyl-carrier-protein] S-malonyltransferase